MSELCRFYGIVIHMYYNDHGPPHFHATYQGARTAVDINTLAFGPGQLPTRARRLVAEWASLHQQELRTAWERIERAETPGSIEPLP